MNPTHVLLLLPVFVVGAVLWEAGVAQQRASAIDATDMIGANDTTAETPAGFAAPVIEPLFKFDYFDPNEWECVHIVCDTDRFSGGPVACNVLREKVEGDKAVWCGMVFD